MKHAILKGINLFKSYQIKQEREVSPSDFYERLMKTAGKYTDLDPALQAVKLITIDEAQRKLGESSPADPLVTLMLGNEKIDF